jgi:uncharacterized protein
MLSNVRTYVWLLTKRWWWRLLLIAVICAAGAGGCAYVIWKQTVEPPKPMSQRWQSVHNAVIMATVTGRPVASMLHNKFLLDDKRYALATAIGGMVPWAMLGVAWFAARDLYLRKRLTKPKGIVEVTRSERELLTRRRLIVDAGSGAAVLATGALATKMIAFDPWEIRTRTYSVKIPKLPQAFEGMRIVQLSDMHLGPRTNAEFIQKCATIAKQMNPDVLLLTGDFCHKGAGHQEQINALADALLLSQFTCPIFGVLGNHDWYGNGTLAANALTARGVRMLDNARVFLDAESKQVRQRLPKGECMCFAGLADYVEAVIDPTRALDGVAEGVPVIMLSHNPDTVEDPMVLAHGNRIHLMFSGHTHGGQIRVPFFGPPIVPSRYKGKYAGGLMQGPAFPIVISRGVGTSLLPLRLGIPAEVVQVTLTKA